MNRGEVVILAIAIVAILSVLCVYFTRTVLKDRFIPKGWTPGAAFEAQGLAVVGGLRTQGAESVVAMVPGVSHRDVTESEAANARAALSCLENMV